MKLFQENERAEPDDKDEDVVDVVNYTEDSEIDLGVSENIIS